MGRSSGCVISGCPTRSKLYNGPKVSAFDCPKGARETWLKILPKNPTAKFNRIVVCERHFEPDFIRREAPDMDQDGNVILIPLPVPRLKPRSLPTIFPDNPGFVQPKLPRAPTVAKPRKPVKDSLFSDFRYSSTRPAKPPPVIPVVVPEPSPEPPEDEVAAESREDSDAATKALVSQRTRCGKCDACFDGPCFEHALPADVIYDKPPVALAYSSLPGTLIISVSEPNAEDGLPATLAQESILAKETIRPGVLFGPLIAPLVPLEEVVEPPRYVLWSKETEDFQAYDLRDEFVYNWTKFIRPTSDLAQINVVAYQQKEHIYFFTVKEVPPDTELRVFVKIASNCKVLDDWVFPLLDHLLTHRGQSEMNADELADSEFMNGDGPTSDEYEHYEAEDRMGETDVDISEGDFERLEEFEDEDMSAEEEAPFDGKKKRSCDRGALRRGRPNPKAKRRSSGPYGTRKGDQSAKKRQTIGQRNFSSMTEEEKAAHGREQNRRHSAKARAKALAERKRYKNGEMTPEEWSVFEQKQKAAEEKKVKAKMGKITDEDRRAHREADRIRRERFDNGEMTPEESAAYLRRRIRHNHVSRLRRARNKAAKLGLKPTDGQGPSRKSS